MTWLLDDGSLKERNVCRSNQSFCAGRKRRARVGQLSPGEICTEGRTGWRGWRARRGGEFVGRGLRQQSDQSFLRADHQGEGRRTRDGEKDVWTSRAIEGR